ncbi:MAG: hypothetical protein HY000_20055 [Planctomycetes bacterium]|nr:hypothetical protein [Planctomycetota bacterium]
MPFAAFDRNRLNIKPLAERKHDLDLSVMLPLDASVEPFDHPAIDRIAERLLTAQRNRIAARQVPLSTPQHLKISTPQHLTPSPVHPFTPSTILIMGAHVIRAGVSRFIIDLMERGLITHVAMNGAGPIHDWEFAQIGATTESVAQYIRTGEFGLWRETGAMNDTIAAGARDGLGMGESLGRELVERRPGDFPHLDVSILAAGHRLGVPVTVHVGIGYDIIHEHPNADGAALGATSYRDFLIFTQSVAGLEGGVLLNFGSGVMGPEVYLKALAMTRNVAHQEGRSIAHFTTAVFDLVPLPEETKDEPSKTDPRYFFRPWKTILARTVADGGEGYYVQGDHRDTLPALYHAIRKLS